MIEQTEKEQRTQKYLRKRVMSGEGNGVRVPRKSNTVEARESYIINDVNNICNDCKQFVRKKKARQRYREMFRVAEAKGYILSGDMGPFNGRCACGTFLICE